MKTIVSKISSILVGDEALTQDKQRMMSLCCMLTAMVLAWVPHQRSGTFLLFWTRTYMTGGFIPDLISGMIGILIVLPLYFRNILKWTKTSIYSILAFILNLTLVATFCKIILGEGLIFSALTVSLIIFLLLTWFGMRAIAGIAWLAVFAIGIIALQVKNYVLGIYGYLFILFGFLGVLLHAELKPAELYSEFQREFRGL